jgi:hypothetical protein
VAQVIVDIGDLIRTFVTSLQAASTREHSFGSNFDPGEAHRCPVSLEVK